MPPKGMADCLPRWLRKLACWLGWHYWAQVTQARSLKAEDGVMILGAICVWCSCNWRES